MQFGLKEVTPSSVAKVLGMMARTPSGINEQGQVSRDLNPFSTQSVACKLFEVRDLRKSLI